MSVHVLTMCRPSGQVFDARNVFDLNDAIPASDPAPFRVNPIVAFSPKVKARRISHVQSWRAQLSPTDWDGT
jgi:hypothetical protein